LNALAAPPSVAKLIGDSRFDIDAARAAIIGIIGYANRQSKIRALADADAVISTMAEAVNAL
jgi:phosphoglycolate phosphatase-like HAD superfamily hydrolase